jgi:hypothetical protein
VSPASLLDYSKKRRSRLSALRDLEKVSRSLVEPEANRLLSFVLIEAHNWWIQYCRQFVIQCAEGAFTATGAAVRSPLPHANNRAALLTDLSKRYGRLSKNAAGPPIGLHEPKWRELTVILNCCTYLALPNTGSVTNTIKLAFSFHRELNPIRNFVAHRCEETSRDLKSLAVRLGTGPHPSLVSTMRTTTPTGAPTVLSEWLGEMDLAAAELVK